MVTAAPVLPTGYVVSASRITDRRMVLTGYRLGIFFGNLLVINKSGRSVQCCIAGGDN